MSSVAVESRYTPEQYLALERAASYKSEYVQGHIYAMAGASREHNLIVVNLARELGTQLRDRPCEAYVADMRVKSQRAAYLYPDLTVICGTPQFEDAGLDTLLNPTVLIEALSPSTEAGDRGYKFAHYRRIASLQEYVMIAQDRVHVERVVRQGDGWLLTEIDDPEAALALTAIDCEIPLRAIYEKVAMPTETGGPDATR